MAGASAAFTLDGVDAGIASDCLAMMVRAGEGKEDAGRDGEDGGGVKDGDHKKR